MPAARQFDPGHRVRIVTGGYRGFSGVVSTYVADRERCVVTLEVFGRQTTIPVNPEDVEKSP